MKKLVILGSSGSIGTQALEIVAASGELRVVGLAAGTSWETVLEWERALLDDSPWGYALPARRATT